MTYYPRRVSHIGDKIKVVLDLTNYAAKLGLEHATGVDSPDLAVKKVFVALKAEVDQLDIN